MSTPVWVSAQTPRYEAEGLFFDGDSAVPRAARLSESRDAKSMVIAPDGRSPVMWPFDRIRRLPDQADRSTPVLHCLDDPVARLFVEDRATLARCPHLTERPPVRKRGALFGWALAAVASVLLIVFVLVPQMANQLAVYIPPEGERALGTTTLSQVRAMLNTRDAGEMVPFCDAEDGMAALKKIEARLLETRSESPPISVHVLDHNMINAFALPGGYVVFFRGLLEASEAPEEIAAVFAHEIAHVVNRDPTSNALRSAGSLGVLGLLFGDFAGGAVMLLLSERLVEAHYGQQAEASADAFAVEMLVRAGISPAALADLFQRLRDRYGDTDSIVSHFLSHPALGDRVEAARSAVPEGFEARPLLSDAEWAALRGICAD